MAYVHGANAPLILRTLTEQLAQEHKVVDGAAERKEVTAQKSFCVYFANDTDEYEDCTHIRYGMVKQMYYVFTKTE